MHPKRFRERIEKGERFISPLTQFQGFPSSRNRQVGSASLSTTQLQKAILEVANKLDKSTKSNTSLEYMEEMEVRDHHVSVEPPKLVQNRSQRERQIKLWLGQVCQLVFSVTFNYFSHKIIDTQTMKIFCSECWIGNIIQLSKQNKLSNEDLELINIHLKKQILPYFLLRYPQSSNKQVNQKLNKSVSATDYLQTNQNNMFLKSKIKFEYRDNGIYFDQIMRFINYIQMLPEKKLVQEDYQTMYDDFNQRMEKLFTSVYNRKWTQTNLYDPFAAQNQNVSTLRQNVKMLQDTVQRNILKQMLQRQQNTKQKQGQNKSYEDTVKQYTKYAINRKISENVPLYTYEQISHGNIKILDPSILRIIVKWCTELEEKFQNDYFVQRNQPFVMINGDEVEMNDEFRQKLCQYAADQWKEIQKFLTTIQTNIYQKQSELSFSNLMYYSSQRYPEFQESIIKFANRNTQDVNHYAVSYLNRLIHGLMKISKKVYDLHLKGWAEWPYPPTFISFKISDLLRCKCFSKQKQIIRIYKQLQIQSEINPHILRVIKVKNRLNKGTKDILLNILFHQQMLCQIQLAIKVDVSEFSLWSDKFNHYIYQLQRSTYGPINELCSIWNCNDQRASLLQNQKIRIQEFQHNCNVEEYQEEILPFTCNVCFRHYSEKRYIFGHFRCAKCCKFWICSLCRINMLTQNQLVEQLKAKVSNINVGKRISVNSQFPQYFVGFKLQSFDVIGQKFRKYIIDHQKYITRLQDGNIRVTILKKSDKKIKDQLFNDFIFFQLSQPDQQLTKISAQQVLDQTVVSQISQCYKRRSESLRITRKNITTQILLKLRDRRAQQNINSLIFSQNCIDSVQQIGQAFPNLTMLNLNKNKIVSLDGIGRLGELKDLYLGENLFKDIVGLDDLVNLKYVQLGDNKNAPQFKCNMSKLTKLNSLTLIRSNITKFPQQVCRIPSLKLLWLFENKIKSIPKQIKNLKYLEYLHLQMNQLEQLPDQLFQLENMVKLMLGYNKLTALSEKVETMNKLQILTLEGNKLKQIPVFQVLKLQYLQLVTFDKECQPLFIGYRIIDSLVFK